MYLNELLIYNKDFTIIGQIIMKYLLYDYINHLTTI